MLLLSDDVWRLCLTFLGRHDVMAFGTVCRHLRITAKSDVLWGPFLEALAAEFYAARHYSLALVSQSSNYFFQYLWALRVEQRDDVRLSRLEKHYSPTSGTTSALYFCRSQRLCERYLVGDRDHLLMELYQYAQTPSGLDVSRLVRDSDALPDIHTGSKLYRTTDMEDQQYVQKLATTLSFVFKRLKRKTSKEVHLLEVTPAQARHTLIVGPKGMAAVEDFLGFSKGQADLEEQTRYYTARAVGQLTGEDGVGLIVVDPVRVLLVSEAMVH